MTENSGVVSPIDIVFRARHEEVEYTATFRANAVSGRNLTSEFYVDHASLVATFRSAEPEPDAEPEPVGRGAALDGIGIDRTFLIERCIGDERETYARLARLAVAWWFDEFERDAEPIVLANARLVAAVVHAATTSVGAMEPKSRTDPRRRVAWREVLVGGTPVASQ